MNFASKVIGALGALARHPLARGPKWKLWLDYAVIQVAVRFVPTDISVAFPNRTHLLVSPRMKGAAHFIRPGLCEFEEMSFVAHFLRPDDLFVDVGANVGAYTVLAVGVAGCQGVAFEPSPPTFDYLAQNLRLNGLASRVTALNAALGRSEGRIRFTEGLGTENSVCTGSDQPGAEVNLTTLDKALAGSRPTLMKIDVEGFEPEVIAGGAQVLAGGSLQAMIIERTGNATRYGFDEDALHRQIQALGFIPCAYAPFPRELRQIPPDSKGNVIYVKDIETARQRLRQAAPFDFAGIRI
jgi:FkbM family methyltransferase